LKKLSIISLLTAALIFVCLVAGGLAIEVCSLNNELADSKNAYQSLQQEYQSIQSNYIVLQQNYTQQQMDFMNKFSPQIETQLGAKVLYDIDKGQNYLWVTGEICNRGYGIAYHSLLKVSLFIDNSSLPSVYYYSLGDIVGQNFRSVRRAVYSSGNISGWEIEAICFIGSSSFSLQQQLFLFVFPHQTSLILFCPLA
jgi:hypothetical protein